MGKHALRTAVFADGAGRRTRATATLVRTAAATVLLAVVALVVSLLADVPLPGIVPPVQLPRDERPVQAGPGDHGSGSPAPAGATQVPTASPVGLPSGFGATPTTPGAAAPGGGVTPAPAPRGSVSPSPSATAGGPPTSAGATSAAATRPSHGHPRVTPPGWTKHP